MTDITMTKETEKTKVTLTIRDIKDEDGNLPIVEIAEKYEVVVVSKANQDRGTFTVKDKHKGEPAKKAVESFINGK